MYLGDDAGSNGTIAPSFTASLMILETHARLVSFGARRSWQHSEVRRRQMGQFHGADDNLSIPLPRSSQKPNRRIRDASISFREVGAPSMKRSGFTSDSPGLVTSMRRSKIFNHWTSAPHGKVLVNDCGNRPHTQHGSRALCWRHVVPVTASAAILCSKVSRSNDRHRARSFSGYLGELTELLNQIDDAGRTTPLPDYHRDVALQGCAFQRVSKGRSATYTISVARVVFGHFKVKPERWATQAESDRAASSTLH